VYQNPGNYWQQEQQQESEYNPDNVVHVAWAPDLIERCSHVLSPFTGEGLRNELGADESKRYDANPIKRRPARESEACAESIHVGSWRIGVACFV
jgi:hypothetical protein